MNGYSIRRFGQNLPETLFHYSLYGEKATHGRWLGMLAAYLCNKACNVWKNITNWLK